MNHMARRYHLSQRAESQEETRRKIVEATIVLHETVGIARTTVTQIAERAGVSRLTVYRHFPDALALGRACSGLYWERNPLPDPDRWLAVIDPLERLKTRAAGELRLPPQYRGDDQSGVRRRRREPDHGALP